jgi:hypothetical protein
MTPQFENHNDINSALYMMATLSPLVKESIEKELYRESADSDQSTPQYILEDAFVNLVRDLETIGLILNINFESYCEERGTLFAFLGLCGYLLPNTLSAHIKTNRKIRETLIHIIEGNLGDNETAIEIYLSELGGLDGQIPLAPELTDYVDSIYPLVKQTTTFSDYLKNLARLHCEERIMIESDHERHQVYTQKMKEIIGRLSDAINLFQDQVNYNRLCQYQDMIIRDLLAPVHFHDYTFLFLETSETLPEDLIPVLEREWQYYYYSHPWCAPYYTLRKLDIADDDRLIIPCVYYALSPDRKTYDQNVNAVDERYRNKYQESQIAQLYQE